jgi:hypothetical protein
MLDVLLPSDVQPESLAIDVRNVRTVAEPGTYKLPAAQALRRMNDTAPIVISAPANPAKILPVARLASTGQMRKWKLTRLDFAPFQYDTGTGQVTVVTEATVEITFTRSGVASAAAALADTPMDQLVAAQAVNFTMAATWYPLTTMVASAAGLPSTAVVRRRARWHVRPMIPGLT